MSRTIICSEQNEENLTREKKPSNLCCVCSSTESRFINIDNADLQCLLRKYGKVDIVEGKLCRTCHRSLVSIKEKIQKFQTLCSTKNRTKRCLSTQENNSKKVRIGITINNNNIAVTDTCINGKDYKTEWLNIIHNSKTEAELLSKIVQIPQVQNEYINKLKVQMTDQLASMTNKKHGFVSVLMKKEYSHLCNVNWSEIREEFENRFGTIFSLFSVFFKNGLKEPKIGMIYGMLMQEYYHELSLTQRLFSTLFMDSICEEKVYDRLQPLGICLSYYRSLKVVDQIGGHFNKELIDAVKIGKRFRIVGDNVNWYESVHDERKDNHGHMNHAFASAAIIQTNDFSDLSFIKPQKPLQELKVRDFLPKALDTISVKRDYVWLFAKVMADTIPFFKFLNFTQKPQDIRPPSIEANKVIPLPVLMCNEQKYEDVVKILDFYEDLVCEISREAGLQEEDYPAFHIGGDQLTRERFSGAKRLRIGADRNFNHLSPITFEYFHLQMNVLQMIFNHLYNENSGVELGTLKSAQDRISRTAVNPDVTKHYDADKDFFISFVNSYITEAALDMDDIHSTPRKNVDSTVANASQEEKIRWMNDEVGKIIDNWIFQNNEQVETDGEIHELLLPGGKTVKIMRIVKKKEKKEDRVRNYACQVLQFGMLFKNLQDAIKVPNRDRFIPILKFLMMYLKANSHQSKYAFEILRLLVHQLYALSEKEANEEFYGMFVNTRGQLTSHIPCDLHMEFLVREVKKHIKHMYSNKTEHNISTKSSALAGLRQIGLNFDNSVDAVERSKRHSDISASGDESFMIADLRKVKPFKFQEGRQHTSFPKVEKSFLKKLEIESFHKWIHERIFTFAIEHGN